jgi:hypothetical protein
MLRKFLKGNCNRFRGMISPYIDGRITKAERQSLESHLASCEKCRQELESLRTTVGLLHRLPLAEVPRSFTVVETKPAAVSAVFGRLCWATAIAAIVLVMLSAGDLFHIYPEKSAQPSETPIVAANQTPESRGAALSTPAPTSAPALTIPPKGGALGTPATDISKPSAQNVPTTVPSPAPGTLAVTSPSPVPGGTETNPTAVAETAKEGYRWPVHQIELAVLGVAVVMLAATIIVWRRRVQPSIKEGGNG